MTVTVGKKSLVLGWEIAVVVGLALLGFGWKSANYVDAFLDNQKDMQKDVADMRVNVRTILRHDSINSPAIKHNTFEIDSLKQLRMGYYTERRDKRGNLHLEAVGK